MKDVRIVSIDELEQLLASTANLEFVANNKAEAYSWIAAIAPAIQNGRFES